MYSLSSGKLSLGKGRRWPLSASLAAGAAVALAAALLAAPPATQSFIAEPPKHETVSSDAFFLSLDREPAAPTSVSVRVQVRYTKPR